MRMKGARSGFFHRSGCEYIQESMRMISDFTEDDANSFDQAADAEYAVPAPRDGTKKILLDKW